MIGSKLSFHKFYNLELAKKVVLNLQNVDDIAVSGQGGSSGEKVFFLNTCFGFAERSFKHYFIIHYLVGWFVCLCVCLFVSASTFSCKH